MGGTNQRSGETTAIPQVLEARHFACEARYVPDYGLAAVRLLAARPGERILDVGCGDGSLTRFITESGANVLGIDSDAAMVEASRRNGVDAVRLDARDLAFQQEFDAAFSNAALHYIKEPRDLAGKIARSLRPGGRFVAEFGAHGNISAITTALVAVLDRHGIDGASYIPWHFPTAEEYCDCLEDAGFSVETIQTFHRPTPLPGGVERWINVLGLWFVNALPGEQQAPACREAAQLLGHSMRTAGGQWIADYVHLRFKARRL
jgi:trans-aconitate methyltransferase